MVLPWSGNARCDASKIFNKLVIYKYCDEDAINDDDNGADEDDVDNDD